jgi:apolipoprotein N-acyltransferase
MWNKIYLLALAVAVLAMCVLTYFSVSWLQSVTKPTDVVANYNFYSNLYWTILCISSLVLLALANVLLWTTRQARALWITFAYFAGFVLLQTWWLNSLFLDYQKTNNLTETTFSLLGLGGAFLCVVVAVGVFFDQFLVLRMRDKMQRVEKPVEADMLDEAALTEEPPPIEKI